MTDPTFIIQNSTTASRDLQCGDQRSATLGLSSSSLSDSTKLVAVSLPKGSGRRLRPPHSARGFTYIALLAAIVIIGISLGAAGKYWQNVMMREREEELLFRGEQYRLAVERYFFATPCIQRKTPCPPGLLPYPQNIDELLKDSRSAAGKRHLRQKYKDPITNDDFEVIRDQTRGNRITGVHSKSDKEPLRTTGFEEPYKEFEGKKRYNEWTFLFTPPPMPTGWPPGKAPPGQTYRPPRPTPR